MSKLFQTLAFSLIAFTAPLHATQKAKKIAITPQSSKAAIIIKTDKLPKPPAVSSAYMIELAEFDPNQKILLKPYGIDSRMIKARQKWFYDGYLVTDIKPGTWIIKSFQRQDSWISCFHEKTYYFSIKPGEVLYLGEFDAKTHLIDLFGKARKAGDYYSRNGATHFYFDELIAPILKQPTNDSLAKVSAMMGKYMPKTKVQPSTALLNETFFHIGKRFPLSSRRCGTTKPQN